MTQKTGDDPDRESSDSGVAETCVVVDDKRDHIDWLRLSQVGYDVAQGVGAACS